MDQFTKKIESMKNAWNELFVRFAENSGLLDQFKWATDGLSNLITWLSQADGAGMKFALRMAEVAAGVKLVSMGMKAFTGVGLSDTLKGAFEPLINNMLKFSNAANVGKYAQDALAKAVANHTILAEEAAIVQEYLSQKLGVANVSAKSLNATQQILAQTQNKVRMATVALNIAVSAGIMIITAAITGLIQYIEYQSKSIERAVERSKQFKQEQEDIKNLKDQYIELSKSTDTSESSKSKLLEIEGKLKEAFGDSTNALNLQNGKIEENIALINQMSKTKLQDYLTMNQVDYETAKKYLENPTNNGYVVTKGLTPEELLVDLQKELEKLNNDEAGKSKTPSPVLGKNWNQSRREDLQNEITKLEQKIEDANNVIETFDTYESLLNPSNNGGGGGGGAFSDEDSSITSTSTRESLEKLYRGGKFSDKQYVQKLNDLINKNYSDMSGKSTDELEILFNDPTTNARAKEFLEILQDIEQIKNKSSGGGGIVDANPSLLKKDRYAQLEAELNKTDILLEKNKALQELNKDDISLLEKEKVLLKQKQDQLHAINEARRSERDELLKTLSTQGFKFTGSGDSASITNYVQVIGNLTDEVNKHSKDSNKKVYDDLKQRLEDAQNNAKRFFDIQTGEISKASIEWWKLQKAIEGVGEEIQSIQAEKLQNLADIEEQLVDIIRKGIEERLDALEEEHKTEMDNLEERHQKRLDSYDEDYKAYEKSINDKLSLLEDSYSEEDFLDELSKKRKEASEIQRKINELSLDDSLEARTKVSELVEQLAEKEEEITKFKTDRERTLRKDNLSDMLDNYRDHIDDLKDQENDRFEDRRETLEREHEIDKKFLEDQLKNENIYAEARKLLMNNTLEELSTKFGIFQDKFGKGLSTLGTKIKEDFIDKLKEAIALVAEMGGLDIETGESVIDQMKANAEAWRNTTDQKERDRLAKENEDIAPDDWTRKDDGYWYKPDGTRAFDKGGLAYGKGFMLKDTIEPERTLSPQQTKSFDRLVDIMDRIPELRITVPEFKMPSYDFAGSEISIDASITIEGNVDNGTMSKFKQAQNTQIERIVKNISNPTVRRF